MTKRKVDSKTKLFMDFFTKELGAKFVDADSREEIEPITEETNNGKSWFSISKKR